MTNKPKRPPMVLVDGFGCVYKVVKESKDWYILTVNDKEIVRRKASTSNWKSYSNEDYNDLQRIINE